MSHITLHFQNTATVIWEDASLCDYQITAQADIWRINVSENLLHITAARGLLNAAETARADRYLRKEDHNRFVLSRSALRQILGKYLQIPAEAVEFQVGDNQKPFIKDYPVHYNLSDSGDWILIAVAGSELGIDVEFIKPGFIYHDILKTNFTRQENEYIKTADSARRFIKLWTRKEAILKATGTGLTEHLNTINALDGIQTMDGALLSTSINWKLSTFMLTNDYPATIATDGMVEKHFFYNYRF